MANLVINISKEDLKDCRDIIGNLIEMSVKYTTEKTNGDPKAINAIIEAKKLLGKYLKFGDAD